MKELILASSSPRRRELLSIITRRFTVQTSDCDEAIAPGTGPVDAVRELSLRKARAVWAQQPDQRDLAVIGSDTVVYIDGEILGKPHSHGEAAAMISRLAGRSHTVCTGVTVITAEETRTFHETTEVHFYPLTPQEVAWYCSLEEPYDKAGAYGIQAAGALLVQGLTGDYFNVMGLPIAALARTLRRWASPKPFRKIESAHRNRSRPSGQEPSFLSSYLASSVSASTVSGVDSFSPYCSAIYSRSSGWRRASSSGRNIGRP